MLKGFNNVFNYPCCFRLGFSIWKEIIKILQQRIYWIICIMIIPTIIIFIPIIIIIIINVFFLNQGKEIFVKCTCSILWTDSKFTTNITYISSLIHCLPDSNFAVFHKVLLFGSRIWLLQLFSLASLMLFNVILQYIL